MDDESYESSDATKSAYVDAFLQALQAVTNNSQPSLQPIQKRIPVQFLAIRNAHGDFGLTRTLAAFFERPTLTLGGAGAPKLEFKGALPAPTTKMVLRDARNVIAEKRVTSAGHPSPVALTEDEAKKAKEATTTLVVEAYDDYKVLLGIGIPNVVKGTSTSTYAS